MEMFFHGSPWINGLKPFLLVNGHGSCFELPFLQYINNNNHPCVTCIGTPYGTALWQVGDSAEQNGSFNRALTRAKQDLVDQKYKNPMKAELHLHDIIPLVQKAWDVCFVRIEKIKRQL